MSLAFIMAIFLFSGSCQSKDVTVKWTAPLAASTISVACGDNLVFQFKTGNSSVVAVQSASCTAAVVKNWGNQSPVVVPLKTAGTTYFKSAVGTQCAQRLLLTVKTSCPAPPPPPPPPAPVTYVVTNSLGLREWQDDPQVPYPTINAKCGDKLRFVWTGHNHDVVLMAGAARYAACDFTGGKWLWNKTRDGDVTLPLTTAGTTYWGCAVGHHCPVGLQKVMVVTKC